MLFGYARTALNADATFKCHPHECNKGLLLTILLWTDLHEGWNSVVEKHTFKSTFFGVGFFGPLLPLRENVAGTGGCWYVGPEEKVLVGGGGWGLSSGGGGVGFATPGGGTLLELRGPNFDLAAGEFESRLGFSLLRGILPTKGIAFLTAAWGSGVLPLRPKKYMLRLKFEVKKLDCGALKLQFT